MKDTADFNHLKNFCEFLDSAAEFTEVTRANCKIDNEPLPSDDDQREVFAEWLYNFMIESDVDEQMANRLADKLAEVFYLPL